MKYKIIFIAENRNFKNLITFEYLKQNCKKNIELIYLDFSIVGKKPIPNKFMIDIYSSFELLNEYQTNLIKEFEDCDMVITTLRPSYYMFSYTFKKILLHCKSRGVKLIYHPASFDNIYPSLFSNPNTKRFYKYLEIPDGLFDAFFVYGEDQANQVQRLYGIDENKIFIIGSAWFDYILNYKKCNYPSKSEDIVYCLNKRKQPSKWFNGKPIECVEVLNETILLDWIHKEFGSKLKIRLYPIHDDNKEYKDYALSKGLQILNSQSDIINDQVPRHTTGNQKDDEELDILERCRYDHRLAGEEDCQKRIDYRGVREQQAVDPGFMSDKMFREYVNQIYNAGVVISMFGSPLLEAMIVGSFTICPLIKNVSYQCNDEFYPDNQSSFYPLIDSPHSHFYALNLRKNTFIPETKEELLSSIYQSLEKTNINLPCPELINYIGKSDGKSGQRMASAIEVLKCS